MMDQFSQILRRLSTTTDASSSSNHFGGTTPFKVQVNFDIPIFEGQIDADALEKWLNLLEGYFSVHNFSNRENITFALLKVSPMSNIGGRLTVRKTPQRSLEYLGSSPLGTLLWMPSRNNITLLETTMTSTRDGPHCVRRGTKQCQSSQIPSIPCTPSWVSETLSDIWF
jgi:hypothetical protein